MRACLNSQVVVGIAGIVGGGMGENKNVNAASWFRSVGVFGSLERRPVKAIRDDSPQAVHHYNRFRSGERACRGQ